MLLPHVYNIFITMYYFYYLIADPPMFTVKPKDTYQKAVNSEVKMPCEGSGQPKPTVVWRRVWVSFV